MGKDLFGNRYRERIPAKLRKQALEKSKNTCQYPKCKITSKYVTLQAHHINLKNDNNRLSNIKILCPTHHAIVHYKQSKKFKLEQKRLEEKKKKERMKELKLLEKKQKEMKKKVKKKVKKRRRSNSLWDFI